MGLTRMGLKAESVCLMHSQAHHVGVHGRPHNAGVAVALLDLHLVLRLHARAHPAGSTRPCCMPAWVWSIPSGEPSCTWQPTMYQACSICLCSLKYSCSVHRMDRSRGDCCPNLVRCAQ